VTEIGISLGFSDASAFTAAFRKVTGFTPRSYPMQGEPSWQIIG